MATSFQLGIHVQQATTTSRSHQVWNTGSVVTFMRSIFLPLHIYTKVNNPVHPMDANLTVSSKLIWIHRMPFIADPHNTTESVNGDYSVQFLLSSIQCGSTCKTNLHTAVHIFLLSFYSGAKGDFCGQNNDCQGNMKYHGVTQDAKC